MSTQAQDETDAMITRTVLALTAAQGVRLDDLADQAGITRSKIYRRKKEGGWSAAEVGRIALRLGRPVADFYTGMDGKLGQQRTRRDSNPQPSDMESRAAARSALSVKRAAAAVLSAA